MSSNILLCHFLQVVIPGSQMLVKVLSYYGLIRVSNGLYNTRSPVTFIVAILRGFPLSQRCSSFGFAVPVTHLGLELRYHQLEETKSKMTEVRSMGVNEKRPAFCHFWFPVSWKLELSVKASGEKSLLCLH